MGDYVVSRADRRGYSTVTLGGSGLSRRVLGYVHREEHPRAWVAIVGGESLGRFRRQSDAASAVWAHWQHQVWRREAPLAGGVS